MSEQFKKRLKQLEEGTLSAEERAKLEEELDKLEIYQAYLEGQLEEEEQDRKEPPARLARNESKIIKRGKWKARLSTTVSVLVILVLVSWASNIFNSLFWGEGDPNRGDIYEDVMASAAAVSYPNVEYQLSREWGSWFNYHFYGKINKKVGAESYMIGDITMSFWMSRPGSQKTSWIEEAPRMNLFQLPDTDPINRMEQWERLEKLPEGTVSEVFVSFDRFYKTDELLQLMENKSFVPVWFAVDAGLPESEGPIGFPYEPMWHAEDLTITFSEERQLSKFKSVKLEGGSYPSVDPYGSGDIRTRNFIDTLYLIQKYPKVARHAVPFIADMERVIPYIEANGVQIYGAVLTGPTKELLKLKSEPWVQSLKLGEARLWNWGAD